jgi:hypothetical protein
LAEFYAEELRGDHCVEIAFYNEIYCTVIAYAVISPYQYNSAKGGNHCEEFAP